MLPKTEETAKPKNYRPITCLPTLYKILTSIITDRTYKHLDENELLPMEQKGCKKGSYGCKDQLLINKMILEHCRKMKRNLSTAWIDYRKAFDSVPHSWILKTMHMYKVSPTLINFLSHGMSTWKTTMILNYSTGKIVTNPISIKNGIFQGDSLSPLLFCLALAPLSNLLNNTNMGYTVYEERLNHLFYMDDLKLYTKNDEELEGLLHTVKMFSDDINMQFGLDKCAKATFKRGKLTETSSIEIDEATSIQEIDQEGTYKYLGINEGDGIQHSVMKEKIRKEYCRRVKLVLKSELNADNKITATNTLAVPVLTYSFNVVNWTLQEIRKLDRKTRKMLTTYRMNHPKADVDRIYISRKEGGRGLIQLECTFKTTTIGLDTYLRGKNEKLLRQLYYHEERKKLHSVQKEANKFRREIQMHDIEVEENASPTKCAREAKKCAKKRIMEIMKENWEAKPMHGQYPVRVNKVDVDKEGTHKWLKSASLKGETEGFIIAAQDQSLATNNYRNKIIKDGTNPKCRLCHEHDETIDHIISGCPVLAKKEYLERHDKALIYMHWKICKHYDIAVPSRWYEHKPSTVMEGKDVVILWDMPIHTDKEITANRPDIVIKDKKENKCIFIDMSVPSERNAANKETEKLSKYKDLEIEVNKLWNMKTTTVPVIVGALGLIRKRMNDHVSKIPGRICIEEIQKIVLLGTSHILRRALFIT